MADEVNITPCSDEIALQGLERQLALIGDRVRGVALGHHHGFYLFGRAGCAKTHTVKRTLSELQARFQFHDGHLTPMGLFELLYEHPSELLVLDDVNSIFRQPIALQLLLAALGKQAEDTEDRVVKYRRQGNEATVHFTGGIICISNLELASSPLLEALKSRVNYLRFDPTDEQMAALMRKIASKGLPEEDLSPEECAKVAEFVIGESRHLGVKLEVRMLVEKAFPDFIQHRSGESECDWKDLVISTLEQRLVELKYPTRPQTPRRQQKATDAEIAASITAEFGSPAARLTAWEERTGKSKRAFYRRCRELSVTV